MISKAHYNAYRTILFHSNRMKTWYGRKINCDLAMQDNGKRMNENVADELLPTHCFKVAIIKMF